MQIIININIIINNNNNNNNNILFSTYTFLLTLTFQVSIIDMIPDAKLLLKKSKFIIPNALANANDFNFFKFYDLKKKKWYCQCIINGIGLRLATDAAVSVQYVTLNISQSCFCYRQIKYSI